MDLTVNLGDILLQNPVTVASGTFAYGEEYAGLVPLDQLGGIFTKSITPLPREGNPGPRIVETQAGMLNAIGLANVGVDAFIQDKLPFLRKQKSAVFVNIAGSTVEEYCSVIEKLENEKGIAGIEINISCPNVRHGGATFCSRTKDVSFLLSTIRSVTSRFMIAKLSPNVADITETAIVAVEAGCDGLSLINTLVGMTIDIHKRKPKLSNITGGLSGPAIKPVGIAQVWKVAQKVSVPIIGIGGIMTAEDALEYLIAGASAVQIGTGVFVNPKIPMNVIKGIYEYGIKNGFSSVKEIVGSLQCSDYE